VVLRGRRLTILEVEMHAEVCRFAVADKGRLGLTALIVERGVVERAVLADVQVRSAVGALILAPHLDPDLDFKNLLVPALPTVVGHGPSARCLTLVWGHFKAGDSFASALAFAFTRKQSCRLTATYASG